MEDKECCFCERCKILPTKDNSNEAWVIIDPDEKTMFVNIELTNNCNNFPSYNRIDPPEPEIEELSFKFGINYCPMCGKKLK